MEEPETRVTEVFVAQDGWIHGCPGEGRVQLRSVPEERHAGEEGPQGPRLQEDGYYNRRSRLCGTSDSIPTILLGLHEDTRVAK